MRSNRALIVADFCLSCSPSIQPSCFRLIRMRILLIPLVIMVAVVVALLLLSSAPRSDILLRASADVGTVAA